MSNDIVYDRRGTFWAGGVIEDGKSIIQDTDGYWYRYIGYYPLPFNVRAGTRPNEANWVNVGTLVNSSENALEGATFTEGGTLDNKKDFILDENTNIWYFWNGSFPKVINPNSTPAGTGGISSNAWVSVGIAGGDFDTSNLISKSNNLSDLDDVDAAIDNLKALSKTKNLQDLPDAAAALSNLNGISKSNNLSEIADKAAALANLKGVSQNNNLSELADKTAALSNLNGVSKSNNLSELVDKDAALTNLKGVSKSKNLSDIEDPLKAIANISALHRPKFDGVEGFAALRARPVEIEGERVYLKYHTMKSGTYSKNYRGGGMFIGHKTARADDGGFIASSGGAYHWERDIANIGDLTVDDFGAVGDGVTDDSAACIKCYEFMNSTFAINLTGDNSRRQGLTFNAGKYYLVPMDFSKYGGVDSTTTSGYKNSPEFVIRAARPVVTGLHAAVSIISDKSATPVFLINHRRLTVHGINWNGQQTTKQNTYDAVSNPTGDNMLIGATVGVFNDSASNVQPFLKNLANGGQQGTISCVNSSNTGGVVYDMMDTLDFEIFSIFASNNAAPVVRLGWSNQATGVWDHSTACNIKKANFQTCCAPAIHAPRSTQGIWDDLWFEHGYCAFDANQAQIEFRAISVESHTKKPAMWRARPIITQYSWPTGNDLDFDTAPTDAGWNGYKINPDGSAINQWQSDIEQGYTRLDNAYSEFHNPVTVRWHAGSFRGKNPGGSNAWVKIGKVTMPAAGTQFKLVIEATNGYNGIKITDGAVNNNNAPGSATIQIQRIASGFKPVIEYEGQSAVLDNRINVLSSTEAEIYVQLSGYIGGYAVHVYGTGGTRHEGSSPDMFLPSGAVQTATPSGTALSEVSWWGRAAGIGISNNRLHLLTPNSSAGTYKGAPGGYYAMNLRGLDLDFPWYDKIPVITTQPKATTVAAGATLTLTVAIATSSTSRKYQWYKDGTAISGATAATFTKANTTSADQGTYKVRVIGLPDENYIESDSVAVTITTA